MALDWYTSFWVHRAFCGLSLSVKSGCIFRVGQRLGDIGIDMRLITMHQIELAEGNLARISYVTAI